MTEPDEFDLAAARLVRETRDMRDEARALGHEKQAWLLGQAFNRVFWLCAAMIASKTKDGDELGGGAR